MTHPRPEATGLPGLEFTKVTTTASSVGDHGQDWIAILAEPPVSGTDTNLHAGLDERSARWLCDRRAGGVGAAGIMILRVPAEPDELPTVLAYGSDGQSLVTRREDVTEPARVAAFLAATRRPDLLSADPDVPTIQYLTVQAGEDTLQVAIDDWQRAYVPMGQWGLVVADEAHASGADCLVMADGLADPRPGLTLSRQGEPGSTDQVVVALSRPAELDQVNTSAAPGIEPEPHPHTVVDVGFVVLGDPVSETPYGTSGPVGRLHLRLAVNDASQPHHYRQASTAVAATAAIHHWAQVDNVSGREWLVTGTGGSELLVRYPRVSASAPVGEMTTVAQVREVFRGRLTTSPEV